MHKIIFLRALNNGIQLVIYSSYYVQRKIKIIGWNNIIVLNKTKIRNSILVPEIHLSDIFIILNLNHVSYTHVQYVKD